MWVPVAKLKAWAKNPRKNDKAVEKVAESIQTFGFGAPLLARKANGEVIAGHTRLRAAISLGLDVVPVRYLDLDESQAHLLALADNKLGEIAAWDDEVLAEVLVEMRASGDDVTASGFAEHELRKILESATGEGDSGDALESEPEKLAAKWQTKRGQTWEIPSATGPGTHRIRCGSSTSGSDVSALVGNRSAAMMWTDPPYGVDYVGKTADALQIENDATSAKDLRRLLVDCFKIAPLIDGAAWYIAHPAGAISLQFRLAVDDVGWVYRQGLVWVKDSMVLGRSDYHYKHEPIIFGYTKASKGRRGRGGDGWFGGSAEVSVFDIPRPKQNKLHPTMKPIELVERMIQNSSSRSDTVYEPFSGSGTTMLACERTGRSCLAMELDPKYVAVSLERMSEVGCHGQLREA